jgi:shikimate 5-dehydrogenase
MLVHQGVISTRHRTGIDADATVMRRTLEDLFGVRHQGR